MESGRIGVELMTAQVESGDSVDFLTERLQLLVQEHYDDGMQGRTALLKASTGLVNVASLLLFWLSEKTGHSEEEILQEVARHLQPHE
jgi:hypothetical protein